MDRITIIGETSMALSIGLALKSANLPNTEIVGSSGDKRVLSTAKDLDAYDKIFTRLGDAIDESKLIVIDIPFSDMRDMLEALGPVVDEGCIITDTSFSKVQVMKWAADILPETVHFVGGHPLMNKPLPSLADANAEIFKGINYCLMPSPSASEDAVKTLANLLEILKAKPLFMDPKEHDSYTSAMEVLPLVLSSAMMSAVSKGESWREMYKLAGSKFSEYSLLAAEDPIDSEAYCLANAEGIIYWLDQMITELYSYRNMIKNEDDELVTSFVQSWENRKKWEIGQVIPSPESTLPTSGEPMAAAFLGDRLLRRFRQVSDNDKTDSWKYIKR